MRNNYYLSSKEKDLLDKRLEEHKRNPSDGISWNILKKKLEDKLKS